MHDCIVIGAGAAGIAAARRLEARGRDALVLEARDRIGGRAWTDHAVFEGIPFDRGAHWMHSASENPLVAEADRLGWRYDPAITYKSRHVFTGAGAELPPAKVDAYARALSDALRAVDAVGATRDVSFAEALPDPDGPFHRLIWRTMSQMMGNDPDLCSTADMARYRDTGEDWPVEDGYGALVVALAGGLSIRTGTPVRRIERRERHLRVVTDGGALTARTAIVTVPTSVLAHGIEIEDAPAAFLEAAHDCPMGVFEKIAIELDAPLDLPSHVYADVIDGPPIGRTPVNLHVHPFGRPLLMAHVAGRAGEALWAEGSAARAETGRELVRHAFGADAARRIRRIETTNWRGDPFSKGSYAACRPGRADARAALAEPFDERIRVAGEHAWPTCFATVHGAWLSGEVAADQLGRT